MLKETIFILYYIKLYQAGEEKIFYCTVYGGGIHLIDLMRWIIEEEILEVSTMGNDLLTKYSEYKYPETICSLFKFKNGITGKTMTTFGPKKEQSFTP